MVHLGGRGDSLRAAQALTHQEHGGPFWGVFISGQKGAAAEATPSTFFCPSNDERPPPLDNNLSEPEPDFWTSMLNPKRSPSTRSSAVCLWPEQEMLRIFLLLTIYDSSCCDYGRYLGDLFLPDNEEHLVVGCTL